MKLSDDQNKGVAWEQPIGVVRGLLSEPGLRFVDPHVKEEREAIQEEGKRSNAVRNRQ